MAPLCEYCQYHISVTQIQQISRYLLQNCFSSLCGMEKVQVKTLWSSMRLFLFLIVFLWKTVPCFSANSMPFFFQSNVRINVHILPGHLEIAMLAKSSWRNANDNLFQTYSKETFLVHIMLNVQRVKRIICKLVLLLGTQINWIHSYGVFTDLK